MYRINNLLRQKNKLFHTSDLALMWKIANKNTLYTAIKRYVDKGILTPIHKGFYSTVPLSEIDPVELATGFLHRFCYVSCETVLVQQGAIFQKINYLTLVSNVSKKFTLADRHFLTRRMKDKYLYNDLGIVNIKGIPTASLERAVADMLYFNPNFYFDNRKVVDWKTVKKIQKEGGFV